MVGAPTFFTVETFSAGQGKVECFLIRPNGQKEPVSCQTWAGQSRGLGERVVLELEKLYAMGAALETPVVVKTEEQLFT